MVHVPDDILMAYVDNELSAEERTWLEAQLVNDVGLRRRLEPFLVTRQPLQVIFDAPLHAPVPDRLISAVLSAGTVAQAGAKKSLGSRIAGSGVSSASGWLDALFPSGRGWQPAYGYAAVLLVGLGAGWLSSNLTGQDDDNANLMRLERGGFVASGRLLDALDRAPSGSGALEEGAVRPVLTLRSDKGQLCRQYEIVAPNRRGPMGLACRDAQGDWRVNAFAGDGGSDGGTAMEASHGEAGAVLPPALSQTLKDLKGFDTLSEAEEQYLLEKGWQAAPKGGGS